MKKIDFESITLRCEISRRGGGIEIDLSEIGWPGVRMTAYQNYLGGGMLGIEIMKTISFCFLGYAILGCIPVYLTEGKTQIILIGVQLACLIFGTILGCIALKRNKN